MKYARWAVVPVAWTLLIGCSSAADPTAKGAMHFKVGTSPDGGTCNSSVASTGGIGLDTALEGEKGGPPDLPDPVSLDDPANLGTMVKDGQKDPESGIKYAVDCTVKKTSAGYRISADLEGANTSPFVPSGSGITTLSLTATIDADTGEGTGKAYVYTVDSGAASPDTDCNFYVLQDKEDASQLAIASGRANVIFVCDPVTPNLDSFSTCQSYGTAVLENCKH